MNTTTINTIEEEELQKRFRDYIENAIKSDECNDNINMVVYPNLENIRNGKQVKITKVIDDIRNKSNRLLVSNKEQLEVGYFSVNGYNGRKEVGNMTSHTGLIIIDVDKKDNLSTDFQKLSTELEWNKYVYAAFRSPSGGVKIIFNTNIKHIEHHKVFFNRICKYLMSKYPSITKIDSSGSNASRACYLPYDADVYFNPNAYRFCMSDKSITDGINELKLNKVKSNSNKSLLQLDSISLDNHYDNILELVKNRTSMGLDNDNSRTSVGLYDNIFNHYRYNNIDRGVMSIDVPFFELIVLKHIYPYRLDFTTHIDEKYFQNTQQPISTSNIDGLDGLEICEVVLPKAKSIKIGYRHKTIASISMKLIFNNPICHPSLILKTVLWINDFCCSDPQPINNPKPNDEEVTNIFMNNYQDFLSGDLDFSSVIRKNDKTKKVSKKYVFFSRKYIDICSSYKHLKAIRTYTKGKRDMNLRKYQEAVNMLQDGTKITQKRIAENMGMSTRNLRRYRTVGNEEMFSKCDEIVKKYNAAIKAKK